jgi:apolipoprotein D and lipocalin family protein
MSIVTMFVLALVNPATPPGPLVVVPSLDLQRYAGTWYEIARLPNRFERACARSVTATYTLRDDGRITVTNRCVEADGDTREAVGIARPVAGQPPSILEVRFAPAFLSWLPAVWGDYRVIELDADYQHAVVGSEDRQFLWILSRTPTMDEARLQPLLDRARAQGFDVDAIVRVEP